MRVFLSIFGAIVLIVALIPTMVMAVAMIGMKGAFWFFGWLLTSDSPAIKGSGTPLPKDSAARMRDFLSDVVPTYYAYISAFILIMAFVLMIAYIVIAAGCILRRRRLTRSFAALGISANLGLVIWHSLQYANTPLTFNPSFSTGGIEGLGRPIKSRASSKGLHYRARGGRLLEGRSW